MDYSSVASLRATYLGLRFPRHRAGRAFLAGCLSLTSDWSRVAGIDGIPCVAVLGHAIADSKSRRERRDDASTKPALACGGVVHWYRSRRKRGRPPETVEVIDTHGNKIVLLVASFRADPKQAHAILMAAAAAGNVPGARSNSRKRHHRW